MTVDGEKFGYPGLEFEHELDNDFVDKVHLALNTPWRAAGHGTTRFDYRGNLYLRASNGNVYRQLPKKEVE